VVPAAAIEALLGELEAGLPDLAPAENVSSMRSVRTVPTARAPSRTPLTWRVLSISVPSGS
jgi:hypothetical protein